MERAQRKKWKLLRSASEGQYHWVKWHVSNVFWCTKILKLRFDREIQNTKTEIEISRVLKLRSPVFWKLRSPVFWRILIHRNTKIEISRTFLFEMTEGLFDVYRFVYNNIRKCSSSDSFSGIASSTTLAPFFFSFSPLSVQHHFFFFLSSFLSRHLWLFSFWLRPPPPWCR
jgi:hypothetical protein